MFQNKFPNKSARSTAHVRTPACTPIQQDTVITRVSMYFCILILKRPSSILSNSNENRKKSHDRKTSDLL